MDSFSLDLLLDYVFGLLIRNMDEDERNKLERQLERASAVGRRYREAQDARRERVKRNLSIMHGLRKG